MKLSKRYILLFIAIAIILVEAGYLFGRVKNTKQIKTRVEKHQTGYKYISPLLECGYEEAGTFESKLLQQKIEEIIISHKNAKNITHASVYIHDLISGSWVGINEKETFSPASLLKVPLMMAYLKQAEGDKMILSKKIKIIEDNAGQSVQAFSPWKSTEVNQEYTVEELLTYMIKYSDNRAATNLLRELSPEVLNKVYYDIGIKPPSITKLEENFMSVTEYASFFEILYNASYLNTEMSEKALDILANTSFKKGLTSGLPLDVTVSHKFGERDILSYKQLHDCGIIYKQNHPFLLCIMSRGSDFEKMALAIKDISKTSYNNIK
jgi:beta-lactamase class A